MGRETKEMGRFSRYNASATVDRVLAQSKVSRDVLSSTSLDEARRKALVSIIAATALANNNTPAQDADLDAVIVGWHFLLENIPTSHLSPLFRHMLDTRRDRYPVAP